MLAKVKNSIENTFFRIVDSAAGAVIATIAVMVLLGFVAPAVASAVVDATSEGYTGPAVVQEHKINGSFCVARVLMENGVEEDLVAGPKMVCYNVVDGMTVNIKKGNIHHD